MASNSRQLKEVEGQWEDLIRQPDQFAGQRVRVTVLSDSRDSAPSMLKEIRRWLADGEALAVAPADASKANAFGDGLIENVRKQGLVL